MTTTALQVVDIPLGEIHDDHSFNCRGPITPMDVVDLARDIQENGLIQPVVLMPHPDLNCGFRYLLIAGYRRYMAHRVNKADTIPSIIRHEMRDLAKARVFNLSENIKRKDLNLLQESLAIAKLHQLGYSREATATALGMSPGWVQVRFMVLELPHEIQQEIAAGWITQSQVRDLYSHLKASGKTGSFNAVKKMKDAKLAGRKGVRVRIEEDKKKQLKSKRVRKRPEIFEVMGAIQDTMGNGLWTRALAWCAGEITTEEFQLDLVEYARDHDLREPRLG
jgi:ParB/RepB/Spo0J family partition protein